MRKRKELVRKTGVWETFNFRRLGRFTLKRLDIQMTFADVLLNKSVIDGTTSTSYKLRTIVQIVLTFSGQI